jgi:hypothetical protein
VCDPQAFPGSVFMERERNGITWQASLPAEESETESP